MFQKIIFIPLLLCTAGAFAETNAERGKRIVNEALAAMGGQKYLEMKDRVETGRAYSFFREELSGLSRATIYTRYLIRPEPPGPDFLGVRERQAFGKDEDSAVMFADGKGYEITWRGARPIQEDRLERFKEGTLRNILYILRYRLDEPGMMFEARGADVWQNQPVEIVDITDADNRTLTVYFDRNTKVPVRQVYERRDPVTKDRIEEVTVFGKYRDVGGGVQWPFTMRRERNGEKIYEIYSDSVTINRGLKDDLFTLPANVKMLKPAR